MSIKFYPFQTKGLAETADLTHVAYYWDMGTGKTFVGAEKMHRLGMRTNLIVCQKSKIGDWLAHISKYYEDMSVYDLTAKNGIKEFLEAGEKSVVGVINYDLLFRRSELSGLTDFTLLLDESSLIQNETAKRSKFVLNKLRPTNVILLSGTPTGGKYERLWSQLRLLGWSISKDLYWKQYVDVEYLDGQGFPIKIVKGYKNVPRLKEKMRQYGCRFLTTGEVFDLPEQVFNVVNVPTTREYRTFRRTRIVKVGGEELVGDTVLTKMLYERMLCGQYNEDKIQALRDLVESTADRVIVFYNFEAELRAITGVCEDLDRPLSVVNGSVKDLSSYGDCGDSITAIQYIAGSMGLNLQKANKIIYFTPPLSSELFEQSKKRTHRIGQNSTCFYYLLTCENSVEGKIYRNLKERRDYTNDLFVMDDAVNGE